jgi:threonine synthase
MYGWQAEGAAPIVRGERVAEPETIATAIRIGDPASWKGAVRARDESGGAIEAVSDAEILDAYRDLARHEGIFAEPASAASVAGLRKRARAGGLRGVSSVVCVLTGHGLKDPDTARSLGREVAVVDATADAVMGAIAQATRV